MKKWRIMIEDHNHTIMIEDHDVSMSMVHALEDYYYGWIIMDLMIM